MEEDTWGCFRPTGHTVDNIECLPGLQRLLAAHNAKPTYLVSYQVAVNDRAVSILKDLLKTGNCEIGAHCHPWNTPPFEEETNEKNSMLCNLPVDLQLRKLTTLHNAIAKNFGTEPVSFRAGRWGFSAGVAKNISKLGYKIETSIASF